MPFYRTFYGPFESRATKKTVTIGAQKSAVSSRLISAYKNASEISDDRRNAFLINRRNNGRTLYMWR